MQRRLRLLLFIMATTSLAACQSSPQGTTETASVVAEPPPVIETARWFEDAASGCEVWDPFPEAGQLVTWDGPCVAGKAEGQGELRIARRGAEAPERADRYVGEMLGGKMSGRGRLDWERGGFYDGEWRDGLPHGSATLQTRSDLNMVGTFVNGIPDGALVVSDPSGRVFEGTFLISDRAKPKVRRDIVRDASASGEIMSAVTGEGSFTYPDGARFEGRFNVHENWLEGRCRKGRGQPYIPCCMQDGVAVHCPIAN